MFDDGAAEGSELTDGIKLGKDVGLSTNSRLSRNSPFSDDNSSSTVAKPITLMLFSAGMFENSSKRVTLIRFICELISKIDAPVAVPPDTTI